MPGLGAALLIWAFVAGGVAEAEAGPRLWHPHFPADPVATPDQPRKDQPDLWIDVRLPAATQPEWIGNDVAGLFADRVERALHHQGFSGTTGTWRSDDPPPAQSRVLELHLLAWDARNGFGTCEFRAVLVTPQQRRDLGLFASDDLVVTENGAHRDSSAGLRTAEHDAMSHLYRRIRGDLASRVS